MTHFPMGHDHNLMTKRRRKQKNATTKNDSPEPKIPDGAVPADLSKQVPNNSYSGPVTYYEDMPFTCIDCGTDEIWTAEQQKWYYEEAKGSLYATAVRCRPCRKKHKEARKGNVGDPNPIKHQGSIFKRIQKALEPAITAAGFTFERRIILHEKWSAILEYSRGDFQLSCWYDRPNATLIAEVMDEQENCSEIANVPFNAPESQAAILNRMDLFCSAVIKYLENFEPGEQ
ncbi:MAG: zinc-ribbon domain-containing protein [Planctomycetaceae bacterium]|nr:zinc-ribbon domain-containing protein [Planctomycetaceae bacterium]